MKNKILLTAILALLGIFAMGPTAEAHRGNRARHKHVMYRHGHRVVVWHNNFNQCGNRFNNRWGNHRMCGHMRNIWRNGRCGNAVVRCNSRGCGMFGMVYRNGRYFNDFRGHRHNGRFNQGYGRGNGRFNRGGGNGRFNRGGGRGNGRGNGRR